MEVFKSHGRVQFSGSQFELVLFKPSARQAELSLSVVASTATRGPEQRESRRGLGLSSHISRTGEVFLRTMRPEKEEEFKKFRGRR